MAESTAESNCCFVLPYQAASGPANMALDEALLELVAAGSGTAYLRTFGWTIPTLSLGYFQRLAEVQADPRFKTAPLVRRLTGGGAIWHHHEVTYSLVIDAKHPLMRPRIALYHAIHAAIISVLTDVGISAARRGEVVGPNHGHQKRPLLCFMDKDPEDIISDAAKIVGSAQRRRGSAVLQHGSLLLARSSRTPDLIGVCDVADKVAEIRDWPDRLASRISHALGMRKCDVQVPSVVQSHALELQRMRYENPAWTQLREEPSPAGAFRFRHKVAAERCFQRFAGPKRLASAT